MMSEFFQEGPSLKNQFEEDDLLQNYIATRIPEEHRGSIEADLHAFGDRVVTDIFEFGRDVDANPPRLQQYDNWGKRIDKIHVSRGWTQLHDTSAEEGLIATAYERSYGAFSRPYQFMKLYMFHASSAYFLCPLAMTDGAAKLVEIHGDDNLKARAFRHLTTRTGNSFWTSGQWMTERTGGSDVSGTSTIAKKENGEWKLYGTKWFTSATTSEMAFTLARIENENGEKVEGSRGLSLFYLETHLQNGEYNGIEIHRLKDKLGTHGVPTAELTLKGTVAKLVGNEGDGVKNIAALFNVSRIVNTAAAVSTSRRMIALAKDYATKRQAFGKLLKDHPLHAETLAQLETQLSGCLQLGLYVATLLGNNEVPSDDVNSESNSKLLRLLTPIAKLFTAKINNQICSEVVEAFGGAGYIEENGIAKHFRDSQVLSIWEGTTNVLSLDVIRALSKEHAFPVYVEDIKSRLAKVKTPELQDSVNKVHDALSQFGDYTQKALSENSDFVEVGARALAMSMGYTICASLLLEQAELSQRDKDRALALRWCEQNLTPLVHGTQMHREQTQQILQFT